MSTDPPQVKLLSSDSQTFEVDAEVAKQSVTLQNTIDGEDQRVTHALSGRPGPARP